jgi:hypothetical protein
MHNWTFPLFLLLLISVSHSASAQIVVSEKPHPPQYNLPQKVCGEKHTWIKGHWEWDKKEEAYLWQKGVCEKVPKGAVYQPGKWRKLPNGWIWEPGTWQKVKNLPNSRR